MFGEGDPGYKSTRFICESALSICLDKKIDKNANGGVLTTASGLGEVLLERLKNLAFYLKALKDIVANYVKQH